MLSKNNTYFDRELCLNGHYIVTGHTNDRFCNDNLQLTDIRMELHNYLRYEQGFQAVVFLDVSRMLYCYDQQSFDILRNGCLTQQNSSQVVQQGNHNIAREIESSGPLGRRRRQRETSNNTNQNQANQNPDVNGPLHMGRMRLDAAWQQVIAIMQNPELRCALVLNNINSLQYHMGSQEMAMLEELSSHHETNHSIVIYLFRDTTISNVLDSGNRGSGPWVTLVETTLHPRIDTEDATANRVINLGTPNQYEVRNLLNYLRLRNEKRLSIRHQDVNKLAEILSASCARQRWGLSNLLTRLEVYMSGNENAVLNIHNWREFTGEANYQSPMKQLDNLIGLEQIKKDIKDWYALQKRTEDQRKITTKVSSRFAPTVSVNPNVGHTLNMRIKGSPGTGKTTIARLMGLLYYELGLLPQGQLIECSASDLISQNVGGTARLVRERVQEAMGGVLFIDEAYSLATNRHGIEAINQLVNDMSAYEGQFAVVIAGYSNDIDRLIRENDGLARRFPTEYVLPDYSAKEMEQIFRLMVKNDSSNIQFSESLEERFEDFFEAWVGGRTRGWGNAGEAENLLIAMKKACSSRGSNDSNYDGNMIFTEADIPEHLTHCLAPRSKDLEDAVKKIDQMIGLKNIKIFLKQLINNIQWGAVEKVPGNYIFLGPPGAGKTTVARKIGEILGHLNVLRRKTNNVVECRAADLLNGGMTLEEAVENARGGVLFIDEAHQLEQDRSGRGHAIIRELVPIIEDPEIRTDTCFIIAGYAAEMKRFLNVDAGLSRRFPINNRIRFNDYTAEELVQILKEMAEAKGEIVEQGYFDRSLAALERYMEHRPQNFGNGGFIRDVFLPESIKARTARLNKKATGDKNSIVSGEKVAEYTEKEKHTLTAEDIPASFVRMAGPVGQKPSRQRDAFVLLDELVAKDQIVEYVKSRENKDEIETFFDSDIQNGLHFSICGPVGCGRHTAIRAIAAAWKQFGYLERDDVQFVGKADLEAGYVGQTAIKTQNVVEHALGGVLVVEYPSSMIQKNANDNTFGPEALGVISGAMGTYSDELCVVFLDSKEGLDMLFKAYPSLRSQLTQQFELEDLTPAEMEEIFNLKTKDSFYMEKADRELLSDFFINWVSDRGGLGESVRSWGNGTELDQLIETLINNWKQNGGEKYEETMEENGSTYKVTKRRITLDMFPSSLQKYMKTNRAVAETAMAELENLTGLHSVKHSIKAIERRLRRMSKDKVAPGIYCYIGNPGVGKTTVASLMGGILRATKVLSQGHIIIRTAREMCNSINEFDDIIKLAKNGVLFIDEAHQLAELSNYSGNSVIKRLLTVLEDTEVTKNTCIILAGYPREMAALLKADSGLSSRFGTANSIIYFDDYTPEELLSILDDMARRANKIPQIGAENPLILTEKYRNTALKIFEAVCASRDPNFGNARFVRNFLHDSIDEQLLRLDEEYGVEDDLPGDVLATLRESDIPKKYLNKVIKAAQKVKIDYSKINRGEEERITKENYGKVCEKLAESVVYLEGYSKGRKVGEGTGSIVSSDGHILTCAHVVRDMDHMRARVYCPGMIGGDFRWFDCEILGPVYEDCDMAIIKMNGTNFKPVPIRTPEAGIRVSEETLLLGYPLGTMLSGYNLDNLRISNFAGRISSVHEINKIVRYYVDTTGLHGNSGSPVFSFEDGKMIGVFSGSVAPKENGNLDEINYFYPISYFWSRYLSGNQ